MSDTEYTKGFKAGYDFGYKDAANENRYNTGVKVGIAYEHDRIIKLLKDNLGFGFDVGICDKESNCQLNPSDLIELIKGTK